jgi:hypothetical protein
VAEASNLSELRNVVAKLADPNWRADPANSVKDLIASLGVEDPALSELADNVKDAKDYQELLAELEAALDPLITTRGIQHALKLASLGVNCPLPGWPPTNKLA